MAATTSLQVQELLAEIYRNSRTVVTLVPSDAEIVNVDLHKREIQLKDSAYAGFLSVAHEHYAETVYFRVPRYFDDVDLYKMSCVIEYTNAAGDDRLSPVLIKDIVTEPGYIIFGWNIHGDATRVSGTVTFAIRFYSINLNTHKFVYSLRTLPCQGKVLHGVSEDFAEQEGLYSEELQQIIDRLSQKSLILWTNL